MTQSHNHPGMVALLSLFLNLLISPLKSTSRPEAENAALRQQLVVLQRKVRGRIQFVIGDRLFFILLYRLFPSVLKVMTIVRPETVVRWHRAGPPRKSRVRGARPPVSTELRAFIRQMSLENVLWGAPRISAVFITNIAESRFSAHTGNLALSTRVARYAIDPIRRRALIRDRHITEGEVSFRLMAIDRQHMPAHPA